MSKSPRVLGPFMLAMITVAAIISLRNLPLSAEYGLSSVFYFMLAGIVFFIPIALVTAELATGWPFPGGSYVWVGQAFGKKWGFYSLWVSWMGIIAWYPAILAFTMTMLAHLLSPWIPALEHNQAFIFIGILVLFWGLTFINFLGIELSGWISTLGVILGTLIPGALIIGLGAWWLLNHHPSEIAFHWSGMLPEFRLESMVLFSGVLLGFVGIEVSAYHVKEAAHPKRDYPRAILLATCLILGISILGTLAIAIVVPQKDLSLLSGLIQAFNIFFNKMGLTWISPFIVVFVFIGALATVNTWIVGPAKGLLISAKDHFLPSYLSYVSKKNVPVGMLLFQAIVGSIFAGIFLWMDTHSKAYWVLVALSSQFALIQYCLMFAAVVYLRYSQPQVKRAYEIPGGKWGVWCISSIGLIGALFGIGIVFLPPEQLNYADRLSYQIIVAIGFIILSALPLGMVLYQKVHRKLRSKHWQEAT